MAFNSFFKTATALTDKGAWCSTGILSLDLILGRGIPWGSLVQVAGKTGSRKSTVCKLMLAAAQRQGCVTAYVDPEGGFLQHVAAICGINFIPPTFTLPENTYGILYPKNQEIKSAGFLWDDSEELVERVFTQIEMLCKVCKRSGYKPFIVIDSLSALTTGRESNPKGNKFAKDDYSPMSKKVRQALKLVRKQLRAADGILLVIDHLKPTGVGSAGSATEFFAVSRVHSILEEEIYPDRKDPNSLEGTDVADWADSYAYDELEPVAVKLKLRCEKSRFAPKTSAPLLFNYEEGGLDRVEDLLWALEYMDLLKKGGGWLDLPGLKGFKKVRASAFVEVYDTYFDPNGEKAKQGLAWLEKKTDEYYENRWRGYFESGGQDYDAFVDAFTETKPESEPKKTKKKAK